MSVAEIIRELTKLTAEERSTVRRRLQELEEKEGMLFLYESAGAMFCDVDQQEIRDACR